jgi:hypothetical protein
MASATSAELAPGQLALTFTTGGVICGYCSTGIISAQSRQQGDDQRNHHRETRAFDEKRQHDGSLIQYLDGGARLHALRAVGNRSLTGLHAGGDPELLPHLPGDFQRRISALPSAFTTQAKNPSPFCCTAAAGRVIPAARWPGAARH